jgi:hypothetical protein
MEGSLSVLSSFLFVVLIYGALLNGTHHWFSLLFNMMAICALLRRRSNLRIAIAGALIGCASFFTLSHGVVCGVAIAVSLAWDYLPARRSWGTPSSGKALF